MGVKTIVITKRQHAILKELRDVLSEINKQTSVVISTIVAGQDDEIDNWQFVDITNTNGVYQLSLKVNDDKPKLELVDGKSDSAATG